MHSNMNLFLSKYAVFINYRFTLFQVGDFGILVRSGFSVSKALFFNFLSALVALVGTAVVGYCLCSRGFLFNLNHQ